MAMDMKINVVDLSGKKKGTVDLPECFSASVSPILLAQAVHTLSKRARVRRAHTKERAEVRGGGRKPWRQKGTGRSRHGSRRSPLWVGGGTTFGPRSRHERVIKMPRVMRSRALAGSISGLAEAGGLSVLKMSGEFPVKTKELAGLLPENMGRLLMVVSDVQFSGIEKAARNLLRVSVVSSTRVNALDLLKANNVWVTEEAWDAFVARCSAGSSKAKIADKKVGKK